MLAYARLSDVTRVYLYDPNLEPQAILQKAQDHSICGDKLFFCDSLAGAVQSADVIGINTPVNVFEDVAQEIATHAPSGAIVYDNGSGKQKSAEKIRRGLGSALGQGLLHYFPSHFLVGRAGSGAAFADPDMYQEQVVVIIGPDNKQRQVLEYGAVPDN